MPWTTYSPLLQGRLPYALPPMLRSNIPGTWAYDTMSNRIANDIFPRIIDDNRDELTRPTSPYRSDCLAQLNDLKANLESGKYGYLSGINDAGPDLQYWDNLLNNIDNEERNWLDAPWLITEYYFYRRVASAFKFFETGYDMFTSQKFSGLVSAMPSIHEICSRLSTILSDTSPMDALVLAIQTSLWGNKIDLSLWPVNKESSEKGESKHMNDSKDDNESIRDNQPGKISSGDLLKDTLPYILDDQTNDVVNYLLSSSNQAKEMGIVVDNAGYELFSDLLLGHILLSLQVVDKITFHTKGHPTFVSDATSDDCFGTINYLVDSDSKDTSQLGKAMLKYVEDGKFEFINDLFWCQPTAFWDMPTYIQERISNSKIVFVKGDANYRRLLGERDWPLDTSARIILSYWPVPVCALRTFKAEIGCGVTPEVQARAYNQDKKWKVSGRWGVVQFGGRDIM